jgi:solute carrier family 25 folate transporter 32
MMDSRVDPGNLLDVARRIVKHEGAVGFYSGLNISLLRVVPNCCITFLCYEMLVRMAKEQIVARGL